MATEAESYLREVDSGGRVVIPKQIRKRMGIGDKQMMEVSTEIMPNGVERIYIEKYNNMVPCAITGVSKRSNQTFNFDGGTITLSPEGIAILQGRLDDYSQKKSSSK